MKLNSPRIVYWFCIFAISHAVILPFLETPKYDGVKRVCRLTPENFTQVVNAADVAVLVFEEPSVFTKPACPTEIDNFAELTAQVLRKRNSIVCKASPTAAGSQIKPGTPVPTNGDVYIYKQGVGKPYYGKLSTSAVLSFLFKVNNTQLNVITGKIEKIAFDSVGDPKLVGFFMQGSADYQAFVTAAASLSPSVQFYVVFDRIVARHLKLDFAGQINLFKPMCKIPVPCPQNPATALDIETFVTQNKGALLTKIDKHNLYDPMLLDSTRILVLAIGEQSSPVGGYFYHLIAKLVTRNINNPEFQKLNIIWIEPQIFPTIFLMMDELEATLGIPNKLPAFGSVNVSTLKSVWMNTASLNLSADRVADEQNFLILQEFLARVMANTITPVRLGAQAFVQTPSSQVLAEGYPAVLECVIENPVGDCLWLKDGKNIGFNLERYPHYSWRGNRALGDCSLLISNVQKGRDDGEWNCEITGDLESPTLTSPPANIVVSAFNRF